MQTISSLFINLFISFSIIELGFNLILLISVALFIFYLSLAFLIKKRLRKNSKTSLEVNRFCVKSIQEVSCLRTEINLGLNSKAFIKDFRDVDLKGKNSNADSQFLAIAPRYLIEGLAFSGGALIIYFSYYQQNNFIAISSLGAIAFAFQKILPNIQ